MAGEEKENSIQFHIWRRSINRLLRVNYAITADDAGLDTQQMQCYWKTGQTPNEFVHWFGEKYDLASTASLRCYIPQASP